MEDDTQLHESEPENVNNNNSLPSTPTKDIQHNKRYNSSPPPLKRMKRLKRRIDGKLYHVEKDADSVTKIQLVTSNEDGDGNKEELNDGSLSIPHNSSKTSNLMSQALDDNEYVYDDFVVPDEEEEEEDEDDNNNNNNEYYSQSNESTDDESSYFPEVLTPQQRGVSTFDKMANSQAIQYIKNQLSLKLTNDILYGGLIDLFVAVDELVNIVKVKSDSVMMALFSQSRFYKVHISPFITSTLNVLNMSLESVLIYNVEVNYDMKMWEEYQVCTVCHRKHECKFILAINNSTLSKSPIGSTCKLKFQRVRKVSETLLDTLRTLCCFYRVDDFDYFTKNYEKIMRKLDQQLKMVQSCKTREEI
jgi:hypothetical protein